MTTTNVLIEELGPRGRRRVQIGTVIALIAGALVLVWAYFQLKNNGQLEAARWTDLFEGATFEFLARGLREHRFEPRWWPGSSRSRSASPWP